MLSVLYVDDESSLLEIAKLFLEQSEDFSVDTDTAAQHALELIGTRSYDAIVSDYQMPEMDGIAFLKAVRSKYGDIPFILFTGRGREEVVIEAINYGADFYLQKGGNPTAQFAELAHKIRQATRRKKAEISLQESERRYRDVVENQTEFISRFRPDGTHVFVNEAYCRHYGKGRDELIGHRFIPSIPEEDQELVRRHFASFTPDHPVAEIEHRVIMTDGSIRWHWWNDRAIFDEAGRVVEFQSVGKDITDRKQVEEALLEEQVFTDAVLESVPGLLYLYDDEGHLRRWNKSHETMTGYSAEELAGKHVLDWFRHDETSLVNIRDGVERALREGHGSTEGNLMKKDGEVIPCYFTATSLDIKGRKYFTGIGIDISDRKQAEEELKRSENLYRTIFNTTGAATIIIGPDTTILLANASMEKLTGVPRSEQENKLSWTVFIDKGDVERMKQYHIARRKDPTQVPTVYECRLIDTKNVVHNCFVYVDMIPGTKNSVASLIDITERRKAEDKLRAAYEQLTATEEELRAQYEELSFSQDKIRQSEENYRSIIENIQDVYYRTDTEGNLILASPSMAAIFGYTSIADLYGKKLTTTLYFNPENRDKFLAEIEKSGSVSQYEVLLKKQDGTPITVTTSSHKYYDTFGKFLGIEGIISDISERKQAEEALQKSESRWRQWLEQAPVPMALCTLDGRVLFANKYYINITGYTLDDIPDMDCWWRTMYPDPHYRQEMKEAWEQRVRISITRGEFIEPQESRILRKDGITRILEFSGLVIGDNILVTFYDLTERKQAEEALRENEEKFRALADNAQVAIGVIQDSRYVYINQHMVKATGYSREDFYSLHYWDLVHPDQRAKLIEDGRAWLQGERSPVTNEIKYVTKTGETKWAISSTAEIMYGGKPAAIVTMVGITERKKAEEELRAAYEQLTAAEEELRTQYEELRDDEQKIKESEENYRSILENFQDVYYRSDTEGNLIFASPSATTVFGYPDVRDFYGKSIATHVYYHPEDREKFLNELKKTGSVSNYEVVLKKYDGSPFVVLTSSHLVYDAAGNCVGVEGIFRDITERKKAEEALRESEAKYRELAELLPQMIFEVDLEFRITYANRHALSVFGFTDKDLKQGIDALSIIEPSQHARLKENVQKLVNGKPVDPQEYTTRRKDGSKFQVIIYTAPIYKNKTITGLRGVIIDISAQKKTEEELRESEEKYRLVVENSYNAIYIYRGRQILFANHRATDLTGYPNDELMRMNIWDLVHPDDRTRMQESGKRRISGGTLPPNFTGRIIRKNGEVLDCEFFVNRILYQNQPALLGITRDISEQKKAETALLESQKNFRTVLDNLPDLVLVHRDGLILYVNPAMIKSLGIQPDDVLKKPILDYIAPEYHSRVAAAIRERIKTGQDHPYEIELLRRAGGRMTVLIRGSVIEFDGSPAILNVLTDITERREAERALLESEEKFRSFVENANDIIYSLTLDGIFTYVSPKWTDLLGHDTCEVVGKSFDIFIHPDDLPMCHEFVRETIVTGEKKSGVEYRIRHKNGTWQWHTTTASPIRNDSGKVVSFLGICRDITERKIAEEALRRANRQLSLLSGITRHDILNKVSVILGFLKITEKKFTDPALGEYLGKMESATTAIRDQIEFTRIYQDLGSHEPQWIDLDTVMPRSHVPATITLNADVSGVEVFADPMLEKVFFNLLDNSIRHGERVTEIRVSSHLSGEDLVVVWEDNGIGIAENDKKRIFERGFGKNTGLGMFLVREILSLTGIIIEEAGETGKGALFEITVPKGGFRIPAGRI